MILAINLEVDILLGFVAKASFLAFLLLSILSDLSLPNNFAHHRITYRNIPIHPTSPDINGSLLKLP